MTAEFANIEDFLRADEEKDLLRFSTAGSVDDGKSTLIGRLLYEARGVYEDQIAAVTGSRINRADGPVDFSLLTDGLRAEREQGITIDVAYRYFTTARRKFIIADTPGHEQYTRNMATGASTADLAVILVDARHGVSGQSRRHAYIASLLGIPNIVVAVNKMDLVGYDATVFRDIEAGFRRHLAHLGVTDAHFLPVSALEGDNVTERSAATPWYEGPSLLELLETVPPARADAGGPLRLPVQYVLRPHADFRGYAGQALSGRLAPGDPVMALPSGRVSRVRSLPSFDGDLAEAHAPMSVTVTLEDEIDLSRGDMLVSLRDAPHVSRAFEARLVWMDATPLEPGRAYWLKHTSQSVSATVERVRHRVNVDTLAHEPAETLHMNEIGLVAVQCARPLLFDAYRSNRSTGSFILVDAITNATVAAGMIEAPSEAPKRRRSASEAEEQTGRLTMGERRARNGHLPAVVWLPARTELAHALERALFRHGCQVAALDPETDAGLLPGITEALREAGLITIVSAAWEHTAPRERVRALAGEGQFLAFAPETLAPQDADATEQVLEALRERAILSAADSVGHGEGI